MGKFIAPCDKKRYDLEQISKSRMKSSFAILLALFILSTTVKESTPYGMAGIGGCSCNGFMTAGREGKPIGECHSVDGTKYFFCYLHKGCRNCEAVTLQFPAYCKNYSNCRHWGRVNPEG